MSTQTLTYACKIKNLDRVADALDRMGLACSKLWNVALYHTRQVWSETGEIPSAYDTQKAVQDHYWYKRLPTHTAQAVTQELWQAYKSWFGHRRNGNPKARPPRYRKRNGEVSPSTITFKRSGFRLGGTALRLSRGKTVAAETGEQFLFLELAIPPEADASDPRQVRLVPCNGGWEAHLVCEVSVATELPGEGVASVDVGIINLATVAYSNGTTELYSGRGLLAQEYYFAKEIAKCKPADWRPGSRKKAASERERKLHRKRTQRRRQFLHAATRHIVNTCIEKGIGTIVLGDLKGIRQQASGESRNHGKVGNLKLHAWPFDTFVQMLTYKAKLAGITIIRVSERNTSRTCSICGYLNANSRVHRGLYICSECGATINADVNGAVNILHKYLQGLEKASTVNSAKPSTGVSVRVGDLPTVWPEPLVNRYDWGKPNPFWPRGGERPGGTACLQ
ncbi:MAG: transposase [Chloroflexi bacterium]|nr:transposase [Chloroflexota bacterium]